MQIHKKKIKKEDGRYLIYYTFTEEETDIRKGNAKKNRLIKGEKNIFYQIIPSSSP